MVIKGMKMNDSLQKVADMIKKTFHNKAQVDCFDGCVLYIDEHCRGIRSECKQGMELKFSLIQESLKGINDKIDRIVGTNGNTKSE